jgi:hypothetical protein
MLGAPIRGVRDFSAGLAGTPEEFPWWPGLLGWLLFTFWESGAWASGILARVPASTSIAMGPLAFGESALDMFGLLLATSLVPGVLFTTLSHGVLDMHLGARVVGGRGALGSTIKAVGYADAGPILLAFPVLAVIFYLASSDPALAITMDPTTADLTIQGNPEALFGANAGSSPALVALNGVVVVLGAWALLNGYLALSGVHDLGPGQTLVAALWLPP